MGSDPFAECGLRIDRANHVLEATAARLQDAFDALWDAKSPRILKWREGQKTLDMPAIKHWGKQRITNGL